MKRTLVFLMTLLATSSLSAQTTIDSLIARYKRKVDTSVTYKTGNRVITPLTVGSRYKDLANILDSLYYYGAIAGTMQTVTDNGAYTTTDFGIQTPSGTPTTLISTGNIFLQDTVGHYLELATINNGLMAVVAAKVNGSNIQSLKFTGASIPVFDTTPTERSGILTVRGNGVVPLVEAKTGAGTGATASIVGDDMSGVITLNTGTACSVSSDLVKVTFNTAFTRKAIVIVTPENDVTAALSGNATPYAVNPVTTFFKIVSNTTAVTDGTTYKWSYVIVQ
jgi:hypothetical protein